MYEMDQRPIRIDLRPYEAVWQELKRSGLSEAAYAASGLSVSLAFAADPFAIEEAQA